MPDVTETIDRYHWPATAALDLLINAAPPQVVAEAAHQLDGGNTASLLLRGLSYLTLLINEQPEDERNDRGRSNAITAVAAFTELVSRLVELDHEVSCRRSYAALPEYLAYKAASDKALESMEAPHA